MRRRAAGWRSSWLAAGCGELLEVQYDPIGDVRPSTLVRRLQQDIANFKATWEPQRKGGYGPVDFQIGELAKAANAMAQDLQTQRGQFTTELEKARVAGSSIIQQLAGRTSRPVQESWRPLSDTLNTLLNEYRGKPAASVYAKEGTPTRTLSPAKPPDDDYDASFKIEQVQKRFETVMKSWRGSAARRTEAPWTKGTGRRAGRIRPASASWPGSGRAGSQRSSRSRGSSWYARTWWAPSCAITRASSRRSSSRNGASLTRGSQCSVTSVLTTRSLMFELIEVTATLAHAARWTSLAPGSPPGASHD